MPHVKTSRPRAIAMWEFSWIERRWPGAGYEDWNQALDELAERGYDAVRIDAFPHLIAVDPSRTWTIHSDGQDGDWGAPGEVDISRIDENLVDFIARCDVRGVAVGLSAVQRGQTMRACIHSRPSAGLAPAAGRSKARVFWTCALR
jgi:hypothetical protein